MSVGVACAELKQQNILLFVDNSEAISGIRPFHSEREGTKRHLDTAEIIVGARNIIDPRIINGALTGRTGEWLRGGTECGLREIVPGSSLIENLLKRVSTDMRECICNSANLSKEEKISFAWRIHNLIACIHPFKTGNGRTARLILNHTRLLLGLPLCVINDKGSGKYFMQIEAFRKKDFLIWLRNF